MKDEVVDGTRGLGPKARDRSTVAESSPLLNFFVPNEKKKRDERAPPQRFGAARAATGMFLADATAEWW